MNGAVRWLENRTRWHRLRGYGRSSVVRSTVAIPVIGYVILLNENLQPWLRLHAPWLPASESLSFGGWRILCLYFGSVFLAAGSVLFAARCPERVKNHGSAVSYVTADHWFFMPKSHFNHLIREFQDAIARLAPWQRTAPEPSGARPYLALLDKGTAPSSDTLTVAMTYLWHSRDMSRPAARVTVAFLFALGTSILLAPSAETFGRISWATVQAALS